MCCWGYEDVYLEDPPPPKKPEPDKHEYVLMSSDLPKPVEAPIAAPQPVYAPAPTIQYAAQPTMQYTAQPNAYAGHQMLYQPAPAPAKVEEKKADPGPTPFGNPNTQFYCRELDGSWQLRTLSDIMKNCQPMFWQTHETSGWPVFYRERPK